MSVIADPDVIYIGVGNSDDKLTQFNWARFINEIQDACDEASAIIVGGWYSPSASPFQNACFCIKTPKPSKKKWLKEKLAAVAGLYEQDYISWAESKTEFLGDKQ